jgi:photosystem II stability/assembly factor-like uncharacterized protein
MKRSLLNKFVCGSLLFLCLAACNVGEKSGGNLNSDEDGIEWRNQTQVRSADFSGVNTAWLVTGKDGELLHTTDGGATWDRVPAPRVGGFEAIAFIDEQRGWAVSRRGQVYRTSDGGSTWTEASTLNYPGETGNFMSAYNMVFADEQRGWIAETFSMWHTEDGGKSWSRGLSGSLPAEAGKGLIDIFFLTPQMGWACGTEGRLYQTSDGGSTWHSQVVAKGVDYFYQVLFLDSRTGWLKSDNTVYRTVDGGETWRPRPIAGKDGDIVTGLTSFISAEEGWVVGHVVQGGDWALKSGRGIVLHTADAGAHWQALQVGEGEPFFSRIHFVDANAGWLCSRDNVYRTEDGGRTWRIVLKLPPIVNN